MLVYNGIYTSFLCHIYDKSVISGIFIDMNKENKISIPVILYGMLFVFGVHFLSLSIERIVGYFMIIPNNFPEPYLRLVFLFFEIILIVKFFQEITKENILKGESYLR